MIIIVIQLLFLLPNVMPNEIIYFDFFSLNYVTKILELIFLNKFEKSN